MNDAAATEPQPLGVVQRYFEVSLFLLLAISILTLVTTGKLDPVSTIVPVAALGVKAIRFLRGRGPELSPHAATVLVVLYLLFLPLDLFIFSRELSEGAPNPILYTALLATVHLLLAVTLVRLYSARATRDYVFLGLLSFAMMLAAAILTVDTVFLVFFLVFLILAVSTFVSLEMRRSAQGAAAPALEPRSPQATRLRSALRVTSMTVALAALAVGTALFFLIPRFHAGFFSGYTLRPLLLSGFDDSVELGQIGRIQQNRMLVMRVRVEGGAAAAGLRWRGVALTHFDGRRWFTEPAPQLAVLPHSGDHYVFHAAAPGTYRRVEYTVLLEPLASDALFAPYRPAALSGRFSGQGRSVAGRPTAFLLFDPVTESISNPRHNFARMLYQGTSLVPAATPSGLRRAGGEYPAAIRESFLQLPPLDPRILRLAREITAAAPTPYDQAAAIERHLSTRLGYTLQLPSAVPQDPLAHFLFERREGHCEYFATAMTVMLRALGIPARYVNGFQAGEYNDVGEDFIVRSSDAHSWVEAYFPGHGWIAFDPTPSSDRESRAWWDRLGLYWDWLDLAWSEWVVNYDTAQQATLAQGVMRSSREWAERTREFFREKRRAAVDRLKRWQQSAADSPYGLPASLAFVVAVALLLRWRWLRHWLAARWGIWFGRRAQAAPRLATLQYQRLLRMLQRRGLEKSPGQTPAEFAASLGERELAAPVGRFTHLYQAARYGSQPVALEEMVRQLSAVKAALRRRPRG